MKSYRHFRGTFKHRRLITLSEDDQESPTTNTIDEKSGEYDEESSESRQNSEEAFEADRNTAMKIGYRPHRAESKGYIEIGKCLADRLNGTKFDFDVYLSCVGCTTCEDGEESTKRSKVLTGKALEAKVDETKAKVLENLQKQRNVNVPNDFNLEVRPTDQELDELKSLRSELEKMSDRLQRLTEERDALANQLLAIQYEDFKRNEVTEPTKEKIEERDRLELHMKAIADLNKSDDIYD